ncbi:MAG: hypothetical protein M1824_003878 [Vezdaea acicularis]|nr:MAG: hypothetical protein M1824_003878 [Vezdaea acicularis]
MHLQPPESAGPAHASFNRTRHFGDISDSLPFGEKISLSSIDGPTYLTAQTVIQQVAYSLSDKIFSYSPETFDLDLAAKQWAAKGDLNANGHQTQVSALQTRSGAASAVLGYIFSRDFDLSKRHIPQSILASVASLYPMRAALRELALLYAVASPFVAHITATDYTGGSSRSLVTDYTPALAIAEELGYGLIASSSAHETQHMALFATLLASIVPTIHIYDGIVVGRETTRLIEPLNCSELHEAYKIILAEMGSLTGNKADMDGRVLRLLRALNGEIGTAYELFEYAGHALPETILVVFGSVEASIASQVATALSKKGEHVGVINVRVYQPFLEREFLRCLPSSVKHVLVLGQVRNKHAVHDDTEHSKLYGDVLAAIDFSWTGVTAPAVSDVKYPRDYVWTPSSIVRILRHGGRKFRSLHKHDPDEISSVQLLDQSVQQYTFWDLDDSILIDAPKAFGRLLSSQSTSNVTIKTKYDNLLLGGVVKTEVRSSKRTVEAPYSIETADFVFVGNEKLLGELDIVKGLREGGILLAVFPSLRVEDVEKRLPARLRQSLVKNKISLYITDADATDMAQFDPNVKNYLTQLVFLKVAREDLFENGLGKLAEINGEPESLQNMSKEIEKVLHRVDVLDSWATIDPEIEIPSLPKDININSFDRFIKEEAEPSWVLQDWAAAAKALTFKEAFGTKQALRPDLSVQTWTVHVKENRRLTPKTYDRNIFHIEFDLGDSGLKYDIGEALGVHAENDHSEVMEFIHTYGLQAEDVVEVPSRENAKLLEARTVYQALMQNVDIFGKPQKRFYEALADFADDENEKKELSALGGPEGATEFKRRAEVDTITYADILLEFRSARPSFHDVVRIVSPMKRREYSIASSQIVTPNSVALLIVVVDWVDTRGRKRFGQATRYLNSLAVGASVTVSVKPSVMKLPPKSTQPIIMAGLGTGLAPFRAFVQYRAWQKQQGEEIGSVLLYMGSRHQREEYLYGEEWEAYQDAGIITLLGRAFSRDQPQKIYIQDRMRQTLGDIIDAYIKEKGAFYLCGPTWPVPDVTQVLQEAIATDATKTGKKVDPKKEIERLKEDLRYVLEVY